MGRAFSFGATPYYPAGTVFVVVVDPTVGSTRKAIVAHSKRGQYFVLPDNGVITFVEQRDGIDAVREIKNTDWMIGTQDVIDFPRARHFLAGGRAPGARR